MAKIYEKICESAVGCHEDCPHLKPHKPIGDDGERDWRSGSKCSMHTCPTTPGYKICINRID